MNIKERFIRALDEKLKDCPERLREELRAEIISDFELFQDIK